MYYILIFFSFIVVTGLGFSGWDLEFGFWWRGLGLVVLGPSGFFLGRDSSHLRRK